jgi:hypothetical protein
MEIRAMGDELLHADRRANRRMDGRTNRWTDGRTDRTKLTVAFRNFAKAPKNDYKKSPQALIGDDADQVQPVRAFTYRARHL